MKRLPNININESTLKRILKTRISSGGEAIICRSFKSNSLFKIMVDTSYKRYCDSFGMPSSFDKIMMSDQKFEKIKILYELQLENSVQPLSTLTMNDRLIGYEMTYDKNDISLASVKTSRYELIHFLMKSSEVLQYYNRNNIVYGDVSSNNLLINRATGMVKFCDMDNIWIYGLPNDAMGRNLLVYNLLGGPLQYTDAYMHNVMTLENFQNNPLAFMLEGVPALVKKDYSSYLTNDAKKTLTSMESPTGFNGEYVIQYVKK